MDLALASTSELIEEVGKRFKTLVFYGFLSANKTDSDEEYKQGIKDEGGDLLRCLALTDFLKAEIMKEMSSKPN